MTTIRCNVEFFPTAAVTRPRLTVEQLGGLSEEDLSMELARASVAKAELAAEKKRLDEAQAAVRSMREDHAERTKLVKAEVKRRAAAAREQRSAGAQRLRELKAALAEQKMAERAQREANKLRRSQIEQEMSRLTVSGCEPAAVASPASSSFSSPSTSPDMLPAAALRPVDVAPLFLFPEAAKRYTC